MFPIEIYHTMLIGFTHCYSKVNALAARTHVVLAQQLKGEVKHACIDIMLGWLVTHIVNTSQYYALVHGSIGVL